MSATIIDGKTISQKIKSEVADEVVNLGKKYDKIPGLAVILVGENPASKVYVSNKKKSCGECGIKSFEYLLLESVPQADLIKLINDLNGNPEVNGILVQLPLPKHINEEDVLYAISPEKDVDCFHPVNIGHYMAIKDYKDITDKNLFLPCTPHGCIELLDRTGINLKGANAVVVGRSNIVGKPAALLLLAKHATVTICHSRTQDLALVVKQADVVIAAVGIPEFVKGDWIKKGAAVIDVGINRTEKGLVGDVEFQSAFEAASAITPVPGGVGPMTIAMLMKNTIKAFLSQLSRCR